MPLCATTLSPVIPQAFAMDSAPSAPQSASASEVRALTVTVRDRLFGEVEARRALAAKAHRATANFEPELAVRQRVIGVLLAERIGQTLTNLARLQAISPTVAEEAALIAEAERHDVNCEGGLVRPGHFNFAATDKFSNSSLANAFEQRLYHGRERAQAFASGKTASFVVPDAAAVGLASLDHADLRAAALIDAVLQLRFASPLPTPLDPFERRIEARGTLEQTEQAFFLARPDLAGWPGRRDLALCRWWVATGGQGSVTALHEARDLAAELFKDGDASVRYDSVTHPMAWVRGERPAGAKYSLYQAIHQFYSSDTPACVAATIETFVFPVGEREQRLPRFLALVELFGRPEAEQRARLQALSRAWASEPDLAALCETVTRARDIDLALEAELVRRATKPLGQRPRHNLEIFARLCRAVGQTEMSADTLAATMFRAQNAQPAVANVVLQMQKGDLQNTLYGLGLAAQAVSAAACEAVLGCDRRELLAYGVELERLCLAQVGSAVLQVGDLTTDAERQLGLVALQAALRTLHASGVASIGANQATAAAADATLVSLIERCERAVATPPPAEGTVAAVMQEAATVLAGIQARWIDAVSLRIQAVHKSGVVLNDFALDALLKESVLTPALVLARRGAGVGQRVTQTAGRVQNPPGALWLTGPQRVLFTDVVVVDNAEALATVRRTRDTLAVCRDFQEKQDHDAGGLLQVGGLLVNNTQAPGFGAHATVFARNKNMALFALAEPERYEGLFAQAQREGGLYVDLRPGHAELATVTAALHAGVLSTDELSSLRPGEDRRVTLVEVDQAGHGRAVDTHGQPLTSPVSADDVVIYAPALALDIKGKAHGMACESFAAIAEIGPLARHLVGEKAMVLALADVDPVLGQYSLGGSVIPCGRLQKLMTEAGLCRARQALWQDDPGLKGRPASGRDFTQSALYQDPAYCQRVCAEMKAKTRQALEALLVVRGPAGKAQPSPSGMALYQELRQNPTLASAGRWILRSSFTGEDCLFASGAGQHTSVPGVPSDDAVAVLCAVCDVVASGWNFSAVDNLVHEGILLDQVLPAIAVQPCIDRPEQSGVLFSHSRATTADAIEYNVVKGFGGGVDGAKSEQGEASAKAANLWRALPGQTGSILRQGDGPELFRIARAAEAMFARQRIFGDRSCALDLEVVKTPQGWRLVQARGVTGVGA